MEEKCYYCQQETGKIWNTIRIGVSLHKIHPDCEKMWNLSAYSKEELKQNLIKNGMGKDGFLD